MVGGRAGGGLGLSLIKPRPLFFSLRHLRAPASAETASGPRSLDRLHRPSPPADRDHSTGVVLVLCDLCRPPAARPPVDRPPAARPPAARGPPQAARPSSVFQLAPPMRSSIAPRMMRTTIWLKHPNCFAAIFGSKCRDAVGGSHPTAESSLHGIMAGSGRGPGRAARGGCLLRDIGGRGPRQSASSGGGRRRRARAALPSPRR